MKRPLISALTLVWLVLLGAVGETRAQRSYDDHELEDRFYLRLGGFQQNEIRTTLRLDAKTPAGGIAAGSIIALESLFDVDDQLTTVRLDGWWRFSKKNRINWSVWQTDRDGMRVYEGDPIEVGDVTIETGDTIRIDDETTFLKVGYTYSFLNTSKYEAWLGGGLNFQKISTSVFTSLGGSAVDEQSEAKGTVPIPTLEFGGRWNFSNRWRALVFLELFGLDIGDYSGRLNNARLFAEYDLLRHFGVGFGIERYSFELDAEADDYRGALDTSYTAFTLYLKGQF